MSCDNFVNFSCWSDVGRQGGNQTVSISSAYDCVTKGIIMHELMHALGFWHEHNRVDRDSHVSVVTPNILLGNAISIKGNALKQKVLKTAT